MEKNVNTKTFRVSELARIFDVTRHFISWLVQTGVIVPLEDARGRGKAKLYSYENALQVGLFLHLHRIGLPHDKIKLILKQVVALAQPDKVHGPRDYTIFSLQYVSIVGLVDGGIEVWLRAGMVSEMFTPESFLRESIVYKMGKTEGVRLEDFAWYVILDIRNIYRHVNSRIAEL